MHFVLTGFSQSQSVRKFSFECVADDRSRTIVTVAADLALVRRYGIPVQDLPLLCTQLLTTSAPGGLAPQITLTEIEMAAIKKAAQLASEEKKPRRARPSVSNRTGLAWRGPIGSVLAPK